MEDIDRPFFVGPARSCDVNVRFELASHQPVELMSSGALDRLKAIRCNIRASLTARELYRVTAHVRLLFLIKGFYVAKARTGNPWRVIATATSGRMPAPPVRTTWASGTIEEPIRGNRHPKHKGGDDPWLEARSYAK